MKIINTVTKETIATILTNHSMSLDEAIEIMGETHWNEEDGYQEVVISGNAYDYDELDLVSEDWNSEE